MDAWTFHSRDPEETRDFGRALGREIGAEGIAIALNGPLGAGKTVFVKGLAEGLGVDPRVVSSPTFVIAQQYVVSAGPKVLHHVDLYRLESEDELESIGFFDMFAPGSVVAVEWADRFPEVLGRSYLQIDLEGPTAAEDTGQEGASHPGRAARVRAVGERASLVLADWAERHDPVPAGGGPSRRRVEMRLLVGVWLALGLLTGSMLDVRGSDIDPALATCTTLREVEADRLGTLRAECVPGEPGWPAISGMGELLDGGQIDLNHAPPELLETLPGIGVSRSRAIVAARPFVSVPDLERVPGIGPKTRERIERWLRAGPVKPVNSSAAESEAARNG